MSKRVGRHGGLGLMLLVLCGSELAGSPAQPPTAGAPAAGSPAAAVDCGECHYCDTPRYGDFCLRQPCGRHRALRPTSNAAPDHMQLDSIEGPYLPVPFDHKRHADMAAMSGGCETCHHHTSPGTEPPPCRSCHNGGTPGTNLERPGLRGAYHQQCLACHREWVDPNACDLCHPRKDRLTESAAPPTVDDLLGKMHPPIPTPQGEFYRDYAGHAGGERVVFRHERHVERFGLRCVECHQEASCARCHGERNDATGAKSLTEHHAPCVRCHKPDMGLAGRAADRCSRCHWLEGEPLPAPFDHASTGFPLKSYHADVPCRQCHALVPFTSPGDSCSACHQAWDPAAFDHAVTGWALDDDHRDLDCTDCHVEGRFDLPPTCTDCHDEGDPRKPG